MISITQFYVIEIEYALTFVPRSVDILRCMQNRLGSILKSTPNVGMHIVAVPISRSNCGTGAPLPVSLLDADSCCKPGNDAEAHDDSRDDLPTPPGHRHAGGPSRSNLGGETERLPNAFDEEDVYGLLSDDKVCGMTYQLGW